MKNKIIKYLKHNEKHNRIDMIVALLILVLIPVFIFLQNRRNIQALDSERSDTVISFGGDVMLSRYIEADYDKKGNDYFFEHLNDLLDASDLSMINLESPVIRSFENDYSLEKQKRIHFAIDQDTMRRLNESKVDLFSFANNHIGDYGYKGVLDTLDILEEEGIENVGIYKNSVRENLYYETNVNNHSIAIVSTSDVVIKDAFRPFIRENFGGIIHARSQEQLLLDVIEEAKESHDLVFVYVHWGLEYSKMPSVPQQELSQKLVDAGVDLIVGHHQHVVQELSFVDGVPVVNGLGNLIFDQAQGDTTLATFLAVHINDDHKISKLEFRPLSIENGRPVPLRNKLSRKRLYNRLFSKLESYEIYEDEDLDFIVEVERKHD